MINATARPLNADVAIWPWRLIARNSGASGVDVGVWCRKPSSQLQALLGYAAEPEMIHRDNMVLMVRN